MSDPSFLTLAETLEIHSEQLKHHGGRPGVRDLGLLESAIAMPRATFGGRHLHATLFEMAAAYAYHIQENQPFVDGNKRTGLAAALVFLAINGVELEDPKGLLYRAMMDIAKKRLEKKGLAAILASLPRS